MYVYKTSLRLRDTDAAGVLYFANVFSLAQEAFEAYLNSAGLNIGLLLRDKSYVCPVVHAEASYLKPMGPGLSLQIEVLCERLGETSFTLGYRVQSEQAETLAGVRVTHVVVDRDQGRKRKLPIEVVEGLTPLLAETPKPHAAGE